MRSIPKLRPGMLVWRPVVLHGTKGLVPQSMPIISRPTLVDEVWKAGPAEFKSVWGDIENLGALPYTTGWRTSLSSGVGVVTTCANVVPCWTHFKISRLRRRLRDGKYTTVAIGECFDDGHDELYHYLRGLRDTEVDLKGIPLDLFDRKLFDQNWGVAETSFT
jgi:hypothetical protein